eukprot:2098090-Amphidinium_carterae.1
MVLHLQRFINDCRHARDTKGQEGQDSERLKSYWGSGRGTVPVQFTLSTVARTVHICSFRG